MSKIKDLNQEQKSKIPFYFQKWNQIGHKKSSYNEDEIIPLLKKYLKYAKIKPENFYFYDSPMACQLAINEMKETVFEQLHRQETDKSLLDMLNILYVAMTRPKERLYVITRDKTNQKGEWPVATPFPDAADLLHQFVVQQNMEPDDANCFNIGTINQELKPAVAAQDEMISLAAQPKSGFWRQKIRLHAHAAGTWDTDEAASPRETGLLIHRVLSMITTRNDLDQAVNTLLNEGLIQNQQVEQLKSAVRQVLDKPAISPYFEEGNIVYNEKDILLADGSILRPDRVVISGDKIVVIDYKTGGRDVVPAKLTSLEKMTHCRQEIRTKIKSFQLPLYYHFVQKRFKEKKVNAYVYNLRTAQIIPFISLADWPNREKIVDSCLKALRFIVGELFDPEVPFSADKDSRRCQYCPFYNLCS